MTKMAISASTSLHNSRIDILQSVRRKDAPHTIMADPHIDALEAITDKNHKK